MQQRIKVLIISILVFGWTVGCSDDLSDNPDPMDGERIPVNLAADNIVVTRVIDNGTRFEVDDKVGVFMKRNGIMLSEQSVYENSGNVAYRATTIQGHFVADAEPIYWVKNQVVDFIAYYPYRSSLTNYIYPIDVSDQSHDAPIDLLYANNSNRSLTTDTIRLTYAHVLSRLEITLESEIGAPDRTNARMVITGLKRKADFNFADNSIGNLNSEGDIELFIRSDNSFLYTGIIIPQPFTEHKIIVTLQDQKSRFECEIPFREAFVRRGLYRYTVTLNKTGIEVNQHTIAAWEDTDNDPITGNGS